MLSNWSAKVLLSGILQVLPIAVLFLLIKNNSANATDQYIVLTTAAGLSINLCFSILSPLLKYTSNDRMILQIFKQHLLWTSVYSFLITLCISFFIKDAENLLYWVVCFSVFFSSLFKNAVVFIQTRKNQSLIVSFVTLHLTFYAACYFYFRLKIIDFIIIDSAIKLIHVIYFYARLKLWNADNFKFRTTHLIKIYVYKQFLPILLVLLTGQLDRVFFINSEINNLTSLSLLISISWIIQMYSQTVGGVQYSRSIGGDSGFDKFFLTRTSRYLFLIFVLLFGFVKYLLGYFLVGLSFDINFYLLYSFSQLFFGLTAVWTYIFYLRVKYLKISLYLAVLPLVVKFLALMILKMDVRDAVITGNFLASAFYVTSLIILLKKDYYKKIGHFLLCDTLYIFIISSGFVISMVYYSNFVYYAIFILIGLYNTARLKMQHVEGRLVKI